MGAGALMRTRRRPMHPSLSLIQILGLIAANQMCSVLRDAPTLPATCEIGTPSPITANTA